MNIITLDDETYALSALNRAIKAAVPQATLHSFEEVSEMLADIKNGFSPDVVFMDIEMPEMSGMELAGYMKKRYPKVNIIFVTGFSQYALDAFRLRPSGYLTKPVSREDIVNELQNLRCPPERMEPTKPVYVKCFGSFEVQRQGEVVHFKRAKSQEMLAYLVSRQGNLASAPEIASTLWEDGIYDRSRQKQMSVIRYDLIKTLKEYDISGILRITRSQLAVNPEAFDCDYYQMMAGDMVVLNRFAGEFMNQYSWAEVINAELIGRYDI